MAQDAGQGCAEEEPNSLLGGDEPPLGPAGRLRWVCGAGAGLPTAPRDGKPVRPGTDPVGTDVNHPDAAGPPTPVGATEQAPQRSRLIPRPRSAGRDGDNLAEPSPAGPVNGTAGAPGTTADPAEDVPAPEEQRRSGCQTDRPGWAGAHRHGAVRPSHRRVRRDRPPRRWC
ncbi:hypothetical protein [Plantactinospora sp. B5E13]|uniref:hypothetical protein n=1 Tax=Plantactinospora sp. B5E13 TaxID=3153758 RepID=UPI00325F07C1